MILNRRDMFLGALATTAGMTLPNISNARRIDIFKPNITPWLRMINANTNERISCTFFRDGYYVDHEIRRLNNFMRDWRMAEIKYMDHDLFWGLAAITQAAKMEGHNGEIIFLSGYRTRKTNNLLRKQGYAAARDSLHIKARALDFVMPGVPVKQVSEYAKMLQLGGVGHYPRNFIHIDTGNIRYW